MEAFLAEFLPTPCGRGLVPEGDAGFRGRGVGRRERAERVAEERRNGKLRDLKFMVVQPTLVSKFMSVSSPPSAPRTPLAAADQTRAGAPSIISNPRTIPLR